MATLYLKQPTGMDEEIKKLLLSGGQMVLKFSANDAKEEDIIKLFNEVSKSLTVKGFSTYGHFSVEPGIVRFGISMDDLNGLHDRVQSVLKVIDSKMNKFGFEGRVQQTFIKNLDAYMEDQEAKMEQDWEEREAIEKQKQEQRAEQEKASLLAMISRRVRESTQENKNNTETNANENKNVQPSHKK